MTPPAFLLILISVFLHAGWNFISKTGHPNTAFFTIANGIAAVLLIPLLFVSGIRWNGTCTAFWFCLAGSVFFEVVYAIGLAKAYSRDDISTVYPLVRALPVLSVALVTFFFGIGKTITPCAAAGFLLVASGCFILPQKSFRTMGIRCFFTPSISSILLAAAGTTGYTIFDSMALGFLKDHTSSGDLMTACGYYALAETGTALGLLLCVPFSKNGMKELKKCCLSFNPFLCGIFSALAYLLVLWAMNYVNNVSYLQAFRQMSLPIGVAMGFFILHEKVTAPKLTGIGIILAGLLLTIL